jgi:hypothetical protein
MACTAKGDEIFFRVSSQLAARLDVMDLKILGTTAFLASPTIALENPLTKSPIGMPVQAKPRLPWDG